MLVFLIKVYLFTYFIVTPPMYNEEAANLSLRLELSSSTEEDDSGNDDEEEKDDENMNMK